MTVLPSLNRAFPPGWGRYPQGTPQAPGRPVISAPSRCRGRCHADEAHPGSLQVAIKWPVPPAQRQGSQLIVTAPGNQG